MDGDLGTILQSVLSDPEQMRAISKAAESIFGGSDEKTVPAAPQEPAQDDAKPVRAPQDLLSILGKTFSGNGKNSRSTALLTAMRPYMRAEKQEKLDRAMQTARLVSAALSVMREFGGR